MTLKAALGTREVLILVQSEYAGEAVRLESIEALRAWKPTELSTQQMPAGNVLTWDGTREVKRVQIFTDRPWAMSSPPSWPEGTQVDNNEGQISITAPTKAAAVETYQIMYPDR